MPTIETSFSDFFAGTALILDNSQNNPNIAAALDAFGYDAAAIQVGQTLLDTARSLYDAQIKEYGEQHAATQTFLEVAQRVDKAYVPPTVDRQKSLSILGMSRSGTFTLLCRQMRKRKHNWPATKSHRKRYRLRK